MEYGIEKIIFKGTGNWTYAELFNCGLAYKKNYELIIAEYNKITSFDSGTRTVEFKDFVAITALTNLSFATELLMKSIVLLKTNQKAKGHALDVLFDKLDVSLKENIKNKIQESYDSNLNFDIELLNNSKTFENLRYFFEGNIEVNVKFLNCLNDALIDEIKT